MNSINRKTENTEVNGTAVEPEFDKNIKYHQ
jgi:hypothetical protein